MASSSPRRRQHHRTNARSTSNIRRHRRRSPQGSRSPRPTYVCKTIKQVITLANRHRQNGDKIIHHFHHHFLHTPPSQDQEMSDYDSGYDSEVQPVPASHQNSEHGEAPHDGGDAVNARDGDGLEEEEEESETEEEEDEPEGEGDEAEEDEDDTEGEGDETEEEEEEDVAEEEADEADRHVQAWLLQVRSPEPSMTREMAPSPRTPAAHHVQALHTTFIDLTGDSESEETAKDDNHAADGRDTLGFTDIYLNEYADHQAEDEEHPVEQGEAEEDADGEEEEEEEEGEQENPEEADEAEEDESDEDDTEEEYEEEEEVMTLNHLYYQ